MSKKRVRLEDRKEPFGKWTVIKFTGCHARGGASRYLCRCECGTEREVLASHLVSGNSLSCGCGLRKGRFHKQWKGFGDISGNQWDQIKRHASGDKCRKPVDFTITMEEAWNLFLKQNRRCALSGIELTMNFSRKTGPEHTASLDRIDPSVGYTIDNVWWVHKDVNMMKRVYSVDHFVKFCRLIADHYQPLAA